MPSTISDEEKHRDTKTKKAMEGTVVSMSIY
jgi:hypothetical protein